MDKVDASIFSLQFSYSCYRHVLQVISQRKLCVRSTRITLNDDLQNNEENCFIIISGT